jgi:hypothetical protein
MDDGDAIAQAAAMTGFDDCLRDPRIALKLTDNPAIAESARDVRIRPERLRDPLKG